MKVILNLNIKNGGMSNKTYTPKTLDKPSFTEFSVNGLPDAYCGKYSVDECIIIEDSNVKAITSNNTDVIDLKILKNNTIFNNKPTIYKVLFKKLGNGSLTILHKNNSKRSFGVFLDSKKDTMKFGSILTTGLKYEKFWEKWHTDVLYTNCDKNVLQFVIASLRKGSIPGIKITTQKNNLEKIIQEILPYIDHTTVILLIPIEDITEEHVCLSEKYKTIQFSATFDMDNMLDSIDCTRVFNKDKGLFMLNEEAKNVTKKIKDLNINSSWLLAFNQNDSDSYNDNISSIKFNNDIWLNYLFYISSIIKETCMEGMLYNIPVGLLNKNEIFNHTNTNCDYEDGSVFFFFGGTFVNKSLFYKENMWKDDALSVNQNTITIKEHLSLCLKHNIKYLLFGSKLNTGTTATYSPYSLGKVMDKENLVKSIKNYKKNLI